MWHAVDNHIDMCHVCKGIFRFELYLEAVIEKYQIFTKLTQILHIPPPQIFKNNWTFLDQMLLPCKFYCRDM